MREGEETNFVSASRMTMVFAVRTSCLALKRIKLKRRKPQKLELARRDARPQQPSEIRPCTRRASLLPRRICRPFV